MPGQLKKTKLASDTGGIDVEDESSLMMERMMEILVADMIYVTSSTSSASLKYVLVQVKLYRKHKKGSWNHVIDYNFTKENQNRGR